MPSATSRSPPAWCGGRGARQARGDHRGLQSCRTQPGAGGDRRVRRHAVRVLHARHRGVAARAAARPRQGALARRRQVRAERSPVPLHRLPFAQGLRRHPGPRPSAAGCRPTQRQPGTGSDRGRRVAAVLHDHPRAAALSARVEPRPGDACRRCGGPSRVGVGSGRRPPVAYGTGCRQLRTVGARVAHRRRYRSVRATGRDDSRAARRRIGATPGAEGDPPRRPRVSYRRADHLRGVRKPIPP